MENSKRKGARSQKDISPDILDQLNRGLIESANLTEWLSVDHTCLIKNVLPPEFREKCLSVVDNLQSKSTMSVIKAIGEFLYNTLKQNYGVSLFEELKVHKSDSVRCWAAYIVGFNTLLSIHQKLEQIQVFAADSHFGVREISWMAVREDVTKYLDEAIPILQEWSTHSDPNIRRFASESIRPNGVWCKKIDRLKLNPEIALGILENLKSDPSKYVQDSVANWLNDASKTRPDFVSGLCEKWSKDSPTKETQYIIKRALRSINKRTLYAKFSHLG